VLRAIAEYNVKFAVFTKQPHELIKWGLRQSPKNAVVFKDPDEFLKAEYYF
jgi:hypothetical protein